ncbi:hypothetical protein JW960_11720 [candidate division KSB1 bacterium]|nr:hypothetical protein [candidate division KSB1 bacterium]
MYFKKEKIILVSLIATLLCLGIYFLYVYFHYIAGHPEILNNFQFWGKTILILIPIMIVVQIVVHILFSIINKILTNEEMPTITDEMDRFIELKALRISHWISPFGFFTAMATQAFGMQPWVMIVTLIATCFAGCIFSEIAKIYFYRKGI